MKNSIPLSLLMILTLPLYCVSMNVMKFIMTCRVSALDFMRCTHVQREQSSTMVKKYLCPCIDGLEHGPPLRTVYENFISYGSNKNTQILNMTWVQQYNTTQMQNTRKCRFLLAIHMHLMFSIYFTWTYGAHVRNYPCMVTSIS